jgi:hypothetical protein
MRGGADVPEEVLQRNGSDCMRLRGRGVFWPPPGSAPGAEPGGLRWGHWPEGHAHSSFAGSLDAGVGHYSVNSDGGEQGDGGRTGWRRSVRRGCASAAFDPESAFRPAGVRMSIWLFLLDIDIVSSYDTRIA